MHPWPCNVGARTEEGFSDGGGEEAETKEGEGEGRREGTGRAVEKALGGLEGYAAVGEAGKRAGVGERAATGGGARDRRERRLRERRERPAVGEGEAEVRGGQDKAEDEPEAGVGDGAGTSGRERTGEAGAGARGRAARGRAGMKKAHYEPPRCYFPPDTGLDMIPTCVTPKISLHVSVLTMSEIPLTWSRHVIDKWSR